MPSRTRQPGGRAGGRTTTARRVARGKPAARRRAPAAPSPPATAVAATRTAAKPPAPRSRSDRAQGETPESASGVPAPRSRSDRARRGTPEFTSGVPEGRGKYVYCIIHSPEPARFGPIGIGTEPAEVHTVNFKDIAAVASDTPIEIFDATRENVLAHERVNEAVMRQHTVIPMSFGTVFKTSEDIVELLRAAYDAFGDVLQKMENKVEFGLKVLWDRDLLIRQIENEDEDVRRLKDEISSVRGSTYFARMQYGRLVDAALETLSERYVREIFDLLRPVSVASRANKPIGDRMIMNGAFLVLRDQEPAFDAKVKEVGARYENLTIKYTGPWPPYNFVNIRLKLDRVKEAE